MIIQNLYKKKVANINMSLEFTSFNCNSKQITQLQQQIILE